ncbi:MAG: FISUMP domain-containing protein, partial [Bacteroidales bacterium]
NSYASIVTVYPTPQIQTINTAICNNGNFSILPVNGQNGIIPDNTTYSWSAPIVPGTSGETSGLGQISIEGTLTNNTSDPVTVKYTVQPFSGAIGNCMGDTFNINVTVYDQPLMNMVSNIRACPNSPVNIALGSEHQVAGQSFYWQNSNTSIGLGATGQGNISFTSTNLPIEEIGNITALPRYETSFGTCIGNPIYFQIFINPAIKVRVSDAHVCPNVGETELTATLNYIFNDYEATWNIPGLLEEMIHQNNASQHTDSITVPIPDTLCNQTYMTYLNIVDNIGCSATDTGTITIQNEIPQIIIPQPVLNYTITNCPITLPDIRDQANIISLCQNIISIEQEPAIGSLIDTSSTLVEIIVQDACGNTIRSVPITVTFSLPQTIQIICPNNLHKTLDYGECSWTYQNIGSASLDFNCEKFIDTIYANISTPITIHGNDTLEVTWTIVDILGASRTCIQYLSVEYPPCGNDFVAKDQEEIGYKTVRIGCNCWTQENLRSRIYSDQSPVSFDRAYHSDMYQDTVWNEENFGLLYSWYSAVKLPEGSNEAPVLNSSGHVEGICPAGWYLPGETEWQDIINLSDDDLKSSSFWIYNPGSDFSLFKAHPAGFFNSSKNNFNHMMGNAYFWLYDSPTSNNNSTHIDYDCSLIHNENVSKYNGFSIRCVKE